METLQNRITLAFDLFDKGDFTKAEQIYSDCLDEISKSTELYKDVIFGMGYVKAHMSKFDEARNCYKELIEMAMSNGDITELAMYMHQLGMVERMAKNFDEALQIFEDEKNLLREYHLVTELNEAVNLYERGYIYYLKNLNDQALPLMRQSLKHAELSGDKVCVACALRGLGEIYRANGNREMAVIYFKKALLSFKEAENQRGAKEIEDILSLDN